MAIADLPLPMKRFVDEVRTIVREGGGEHVVTAKVAERLRSLLLEGVALDPRYTRPKSDSYVLYPVWVEPDGSFCVATAVWDVGQVTPIHDHGTWGVIGIYQGVEHEVRFKPEAAQGTVKLRHLETRDIPEQRVIVCCTSDQDIHRVGCGSARPCVGIHVYGADIGTIARHVYNADTGEVRTFVSRWAALDA